MVVLDRGGYVATPTGEAAAGDPGQSVKPAVTAEGHARQAGNLHTVEVVHQHRVDHACDGVRTISDRAADRQNIEVADQRGGNRIEINLRTGGVGGHKQRGSVARNEAAAIDQGQGPLGPEVEQVDEGRTETGRLAAVGAERRRARSDQGNVVEHVEGVGEGARRDLFLGHLPPGDRTVELGPGDARSGYEDGLALFGIAQSVAVTVNAIRGFHRGRSGGFLGLRGG